MKEKTEESVIRDYNEMHTIPDLTHKKCHNMQRTYDQEKKYCRDFLKATREIGKKK